MIKITQSLFVRLFHALNLIALVAMIGSGLEIYAANPVFGGRGGWPGPEFLRLGGWLAGGRHLHFFFMWLFALNLLNYGVYVFMSRHWQRRYPGKKDLKCIVKKANPKRVNYAWHRLTLLALIVMLLLGLYTGLGMYKPVQFAWIVSSLGGDWMALRIAHLLPVLVLPILAVIHVWRGYQVGGFTLLQSILFDAYRRCPQPPKPTSEVQEIS